MLISGNSPFAINRRSSTSHDSSCADAAPGSSTGIVSESPHCGPCRVADQFCAIV
jgi:hypothetical protein